MINTVRSVGESIKSKCTKCKTVTRHLIIALVGGKPARVQCTICQGFHNYRPPAPQKPPRGARGGAPRAVRRPAAVAAIEEEWQGLIRERGSEQAARYDMASSFRVGDLLDHPTFGLGQVRKTIPPDKIEVHFRHAIKRLRCSLAGS
jgi:hypothetical protein